jgi:mannitol-1-phosphate 5-dehydrogenase
VAGKKTFLGFGLGAVQSGLMLYEALKSDNFSRYVILEVNKDLVEAIRRYGNEITVNTAGKDGIVKSTLSGFEIYNPNDLRDHDSIVSSIFQADEMATAVPSVDFYDAGDNSIARLLAQNINPDKPQILYAAENNNFAAEMLLEKMMKHDTGSRLRQFQPVNTVIGKMGGVTSDENIVKELNLEWMTPYSKGAILVEEFNSIIISKIVLPGFKRGIEVFQEKDDLLPFEEAKLFGHNAVHSMLGFFAALRGYHSMSEIRSDPSLYEYGLNAFDECGELLLRKYRDVDDPLFTREGFRRYGTDLLERMTNPYLCDAVQRICRDPVRKMGYHDRFFGAIREALSQHVYPKIMAKAVLGGICYIINNKVDADFIYPVQIDELDEHTVRSILHSIWKDDGDHAEREESLRVVCAELHEFMEEFVHVKN